MVLLVVLPFASNFLIRIYAWMIMLGPESALSHFINAFLGVFGIGPGNVIVLTICGFGRYGLCASPFMVLPLYTNLEKHDPSLLDAAQDLGAARWQRFWRVTWPLSLPGVFSGSALVFIPVLGMFAVPDILGGTGDILIGNLIKDQFLVTRDWPFGSVLSIMLTLAVLAIAGLAAWFARSSDRAEGSLIMRRGTRWLWSGGNTGLRVSLHSACHRRDVFVQRFQAQCGMGGIHSVLV